MHRQINQGLSCTTVDFAGHWFSPSSSLATGVNRHDPGFYVLSYSEYPHDTIKNYFQ
jgi:hypothetical protein